MASTEKDSDGPVRDVVEKKEPCLSRCARAMPHPRDIKQRFCDDLKDKNGPMAKATYVFEYVS